MKRHSCGAILYTIYNNKIYIVLGMEKGQWFPFKGTRDKGETNIQAAVREIYEETCGVIQLNTIDLKCHFSTKRKHYHIGLVKIDLDSIKQFYKNKNYLLNKKIYNTEYNAYLEKSDIKMFSLKYIFENNFHDVTILPIKYYYKQLKMIEKNIIHVENSKSSPYLNALSSTCITQKTAYDSIKTLCI